ncbi:uncharacterized protein METZ01_LOCUS140980, partial [marine metagenome]
MDTSWPKWPELLAKKLDMEVINLAHMGAGNEYIFASLLEQMISIPLKEIGLILPAWTQCKRKDIKTGGKWNHLTRERTESIHYTTYIHGNMEYRIEQSIIQYYSFQEICKSNNFPFKQVQMIPICRGYDWNDRLQIHEDRGKWDKELLKHIHDSPFIDKIESTFLGWPMDRK